MAEKDTIVLDPNGDILIILKPEDPAPKVSKKPHNADNLIYDNDIPDKGVDGSNTIEAAMADANINEPKAKEWRFKGSQAHLILASEYVKTMLTGGKWRETVIHNDGLRHWVLTNFEGAAFAIVLRIIHGKNEKVPRTVDLDMLLEIARVVDYIQCREVMQAYSSLWISHLEDTVPVTFTTKLNYWICIAGVFGHDVMFERCTRVALCEGRSALSTLGLPILHAVYDRIEIRRQEHLKVIFDCLKDMEKRLASQNVCCPACDAMRLGTLVRHTRTHLDGYKNYSESISQAVGALNDLLVPGKCPKAVNVEGDDQNVNAVGRRRLCAPRAALRKRAKRNAASVEEEAEKPELVEPAHCCGFAELIAEVNSLESKIKGLNRGVLMP